MPLIATVISDPKAAAIDDTLVARLRNHFSITGEARVLNERIALDLALDDGGTPPRELAATMREAAADRPVDVFVQQDEARRKRLLIADMDSTMIGQECIDELAAELGLKDRIAAITERAMRGEIEFEPALRERVGLLAGLDVAVIASVIENRITLTPGAKTLVATMRTNGAYCALVSGGFTAFTSHIAAEIGFDENQANTLLTEGGKLTGKVAEPILGRDAKRARLQELADEKGLAMSETLAVGDGANDLAMIELAGLGVAYHAKPTVAEQADARIDHGDLSALLYLQGYSAGEFVAQD
ncbi:phosphoserine phosphatase SerB [Rhizobiales bacterium]|uniref:phosphoserine phosphatase SerB n=1 Tax=Hongsoonwoonella zoysiae TaxID=2821844 RepID=UPI00155FBFF3|nr:phosphoserine phosphatase SerB [Hongsoonwoonella zoysiae]NRG17882.1 phosphoserine phosphatase SerB [Hongsoonwoonella zoysiae]